MIYKIYDEYDLKQEFIDWGRDYFSQEACSAIVEYYEGSDEELDIIGLCGDWCEENIEYIKSNVLGIEEDATIEEVLDELTNYTYAVQTSEDTILYLSF